MAQIVYTVFVFSNHQTECDERWFSVSRTLHYHPTTSMAGIFQNSCHSSDVFLVFVVPGLPLHSASSIDSSPATNWLFHRNTVARDTDELPNAFTDISYIFAAINLALQQNFIVTHCSKFFSIVIYNTSTKHTKLQNALMLSHMNGLTSNLICRWRRV